MFCKIRVLRHRIPLLQSAARTFLSDNYKCSEAWQSRLSPAYMQKIKLETFYYDIEQSINQHGKPSAIDIDIFVNKVIDDSHTDEVTDLLHKLRLTEETTNTLESTRHAVIRTFLENGKIEELIQILDDRLNYGVFLDHYIANYLLDELIKKNNYKSAAQVAGFLMLQEDFDNELTQSLALYACYKFLADPQSFYEQETVDNDEQKEEKKVRVKFIRNPFFDDHFDLRNHNDIVGKTMAMIGTHLKNDIGTNAQLLGNVLFQKYDKALKVLQNNSEGFYKDIIEKSLKFIEENLTEQSDENCLKLKSILETVASSDKLKTNNFEAELENLVKSSVKALENGEIQKQTTVYNKWIEQREAKLQEEFERLQRTNRLREIEKMTKDMEKEEQKLWFFENEDKIDLQIDSKKVTYPKRWFGKKKKPRAVDEGYVPPEIRQR